MIKEEISLAFQLLQDEICSKLSLADGSTFHEDNWKRIEGGGGRTRVINGEHIEKGGVNFSAVHGPLHPLASKTMNLPECDFFATGVSIVLHPVNPWVPIIHMNIRYFETSTGNWWFGGGIDLTPHYVIPIQAAKFHKQLAMLCNGYKPNAYLDYKDQADKYFYIDHRHEMRGIGGIFFDHLGKNENKSKSEIFDFVLEVGKNFAPMYLEIFHENKNKPYSESNKEWQFIRRGRYVEFNLVYDRGTKFGLQTDGRTESILMSLPPMASWKYDFQPEKDSDEERNLQYYQPGINWLKQ